MAGWRGAEWLLTTLLFAWGWHLFQPGDFFEFPAYALLGTLLSDTSWGVLAMAVGTLRCIGLAVNGLWRRTPLLRGLGCIAGGLIWLTIAVLMYLANYRHDAFLPAGAVFYPVFFVFEGICMVAIGWDVQRQHALSPARA